MSQEILGIDQKKLSAAICSICADIIDHVICPLAGLDADNVSIFDPYLICIGELPCNAGHKGEDTKKICREIKAQIEHRYGFEKGRLACFDQDTSVALLACYILEYGNADVVKTVL